MNKPNSHNMNEEEIKDDRHFVNLYHPNRKKWTIALVVILLPWYLNDFVFMELQNNTKYLYIFDHLQRFFNIALCYFFFGQSGLRLSSSLAPKEKRDKVLDYIVFPLLIALLFVFINVSINFLSPPSWKEGFSFPGIKNPIWQWLDLTFGLVLVSLSEELVFRRHVYSYFASLLKADYLANIIQAILFGLIHWCSGITSVINGIIFGLIAGLFYDRKKYLIPVIILHTIVNFTISKIFP